MDALGEIELWQMQWWSLKYLGTLRVNHNYPDATLSGK